MNNQNPPEVPVRISASRDRIYSLTITCCPYCGKRHTHDGGTTEGEVSLGRRVAHCLDKSRDNPGYILVEML